MKVEIDVPFSESGMTIDENLELVLDPSSHDVTWDYIKRWLMWEAKEEEVKRIFLAAAALMQADAGTVGECIDTAIVWERG